MFKSKPGCCQNYNNCVTLTENVIQYAKGLMYVEILERHNDNVLFFKLSLSLSLSLSAYTFDPWVGNMYLKKFNLLFSFLFSRVSGHHAYNAFYECI